MVKTSSAAFSKARIFGAASAMALVGISMREWRPVNSSTSLHCSSFLMLHDIVDASTCRVLAAFFYAAKVVCRKGVLQLSDCVASQIMQPHLSIDGHSIYAALAENSSISDS